ncbi:uncharacterized protein LOC143071173 isoform X1 [Mytilus galloprovincialis]|uniref:uncharacterized protein LOC143071173 isoform X1 n=1 Tax=Mytilus galloprovincialis TaxID=29158 RepID=UPI003F7C3715
MERQHWCSFCRIPFENKYSLRGHLYIHAKQPRVPCSICPLTFAHYSQLGKHLRYMHSDYIINTFVENAESIYRKNITGITPWIESDSEWADSSEEETITNSEEENISEDTDSENVEETVENFSNETQYILATNVNDVSDNKNTVGEFVSKGVNTKHMNNLFGHNRNVKSCGVSFLVELERGKAGIHHLNITRNISNSKDNSKRHILQQHMESEFLSTDDRVSFQRPRDENTDPDLRDKDPPEKTLLQTEQNIQQTPWTDLDREEKEQLDYEEMKAMICQDGVNDEEESIKMNEDQELAVADVVYNPGQSVWTEAIDILKSTFMKKKKIVRVRGMFASTNTVTFTKWLPAHFPVEGVICGCGRHLKTPKSLLVHLRRKSSADRKNVKLFKQGI